MPDIRVTPEEVEAILETKLTDACLDPFIAAAHQLVEDRLSGKTYTGPTGAEVTISEASMTEIERWLAAHFASMWDKRTATDTVGPGTFEYEGETAMRLDFTRYGQQAIILDPTDCLAELGDPDTATVSFVWDVSSERDYPPGTLTPPTSARS
jgi:hypothetical protein